MEALTCKFPGAVVARLLGHSRQHPGDGRLTYEINHDRHYGRGHVAGDDFVEFLPEDDVFTYSEETLYE